MQSSIVTTGGMHATTTPRGDTKARNSPGISALSSNETLGEGAGSQGRLPGGGGFGRAGCMCLGLWGSTLRGWSWPPGCLPLLSQSDFSITLPASAGREVMPGLLPQPLGAETACTLCHLHRLVPPGPVC